MNLIRSIAMAFSMFSRIPVPRVEWKSENMRYMLAALPLVGVVEGVLLYLFALLCTWLGIGSVLYAAGMALLPVLYTGGIHLDGFMDTVDALSSHGDMKKRCEILKDPHTGAFAVIFVCAYLIAMTALYTETAGDSGVLALCCIIPVLSRTLSGIAGVCFPVSQENGTLSQFCGSANKTAAVAALCVWFAVTAAGALIIDVTAGAMMLIAALLAGVYVLCMSRSKFGGMSGDISGFLLQTAELLMLTVVVIVRKAVML